MALYCNALYSLILNVRSGDSDLMEKKFLSGLLLGFIIATASVYLLETIDELIKEGDMIKGSFFLIVTVLYIPIGIWSIKTNSQVAYTVLMAGTVALIILYTVTRTETVQAIGMEVGEIGNLGILSKVFQTAIIILAGLIMYSNNKKQIIIQKNR
jgi:hypothetical protein